MNVVLLKQACQWLLGIIEIMIFIRVAISIIHISTKNIFVQFIYNATEPILGPIRIGIEKLVKRNNMILDLSPLVAIFFIDILKKFIINM